MWSFLEFKFKHFFIMFGVYVPQINNFFLIHNFVFLCFCFYMRFDHFLYILTSFFNVSEQHFELLCVWIVLHE